MTDYFMISPNWADGIIYRRKWQTSILSTLNNREQRSCLFTWPRRSLEYIIMTKDRNETMNINRKLYKNITNVIGVPFWQDRTELLANANSGQNIIYANTKYRNFDIYGKCVLYESALSWEVKTIKSFTDNQIELNENLQLSWPKSTAVYPLLVGRVKNEQSINLLTSSIIELRIEVIEEYDQIIRRIWTNEFPLYKNYALFYKSPNWNYPIEVRFINPYHYLAFLGKSISMTHTKETEFSIKSKHLCGSKKEIQDYIGLFDHCMGRYENFWSPSWLQNLKIIQPFNASDDRIAIENEEFESYWKDKKASNYIFILWPNNTFVCLEVLQFNPPNTLIFTTPIGKSASLAELQRLLCSFLYLVRFDQDELAIEYYTDSIANIDISLKTNFTETVMGQS